MRLFLVLLFRGDIYIGKKDQLKVTMCEGQETERERERERERKRESETGRGSEKKINTWHKTNYSPERRKVRVVAICRYGIFLPGK